MVAIIGGVLEVLGLLSGVILMVAPLGIGPATPGIITWLMFPCLTIAGFVLLAMASPKAPIALLSRLAGGALLVLALASIVVLFLAANGLAGFEGESHASLWYVMVVGFVLGGAGFSLRRSSVPPQADASAKQ
jgi:hypothetical protein